jgi:hypothetical protein
MLVIIYHTFLCNSRLFFDITDINHFRARHAAEKEHSIYYLIDCEIEEALSVMSRCHDYKLKVKENWGFYRT